MCENKSIKAEMTGKQNQQNWNLMDPILTLPSEFVSSTLAYVGQLFTDLKLLIAVAIGLPLGYWVISKAISLVRGRAR